MGLCVIELSKGVENIVNKNLIRNKILLKLIIIL